MRRKDRSGTAQYASRIRGRKLASNNYSIYFGLEYTACATVGWSRTLLGLRPAQSARTLLLPRPPSLPRPLMAAKARKRPLHILDPQMN